MASVKLKEQYKIMPAESPPPLSPLRAAGRALTGNTAPTDAAASAEATATSIAAFATVIANAIVPNAAKETSVKPENTTVRLPDD